MKRRGIFLALAVLAATILSSCGGGGGGGGTNAGIGGTGITSSGSITGIGSIYVNGVRYNVDNATVTVNDSPSFPNELKVGMVVTVIGKLDAIGSTTGSADTVVYDNEIQGPVTGLMDPTGDGLIQQFTIMGQMVEISSTGTVFEDEGGGVFDFINFFNGDNVEVSGFVDQNNVLKATRVEKKNGTEVELKGTVANYNANGGAASMGSFMLGTITVEIDGNTDTSNIPGGIADLLAVEVKGNLAGATTITAKEIELNDDGLGDDLSSVSLEGIVTGFTNITNTFMVAGQFVDASGASLEPSNLVLANDVKVEVEGDIVNGVLVATEVEARSGKVKLHATVSSVLGSTITMGYFSGTVPVLVDNKTSFKDGLTFNLIASGDFLEIEGYQDLAGNVIASQVKLKTTDKDLLQGPVDAPKSSGGAQITVLGVQYIMGFGTDYADQSEVSKTSAEFFALMNVGETVKIEDDLNPATDGVADEVELE